MSPKKSRPKEPFTAQAMMETPLGTVFLSFSTNGLQRLTWLGEKEVREGVVMGPTPQTQALPPGKLKAWHDRVAQALEDYFTGKPSHFEALELDLQGAPFHLLVWQELRRIPAGTVVTYQDLARRLGIPRGARAVGQACGHNPIPIIVPCHRVVAAHGRLGGYSSGLPRKQWLLKHEGVKI